MLTSPKLIPGVISSFRQARWVWPRDEELKYWVLHTPQGAETPTYAEALGDYFATTSTVASTHFGTDSNSTVRYATDDQRCAGARGANRYGSHVEIAGRADQSAAQWADAFSTEAVRRAAILFAEVGFKVHGIPPVYLTRTQMAAGDVKGIITHEDAVAVWGGDYRSDPGEFFPFDLHMSFIKERLGMTPPQDQWHKIFNATPNGADPNGIIEWFQRGLSALGYYPKSKDINGVMRVSTRRSWERYEIAKGYANPNDRPGKKSILDFIADTSIVDSTADLDALTTAATDANDILTAALNP